MPRTVPGKETRGDIAALVKYRPVDGVEVGGMGRGLTQQFTIGRLVREWAALRIEGDMGSAEVDEGIARL